MCVYIIYSKSNFQALIFVIKNLILTKNLSYYINLDSKLLINIVIITIDSIFINFSTNFNLKNGVKTFLNFII